MNKSVIYEIINLYNLKNGIKPYLYIGSQQKYTEKYLQNNTELDLRSTVPIHDKKNTFFLRGGVGL